jgi:cobalt-zinc-cadmium efflux system membrane fusion protein
MIVGRPLVASLSAALCGVVLCAGCKPSVKGDPSPSGSATTAASSPPSPAAHVRTVSIDPALLQSGRVKVGTVERRVPTTELRTPGEVRSGEAGAAEAGVLVSGRIASLDVVEGAVVQRGQILAWVDAPEVARAAADLLRARARAAVATRKRQRQVDLQEQAATSKNAVAEARAEDETAHADLLAARSLLASLGAPEPPADADARALIVRVPVRSPIAGVVAQRFGVLGGAVSPDKPLFRIVSDKAVSVTAKIPETVTPKPGPGAPAVLRERGDAMRRCQADVTGSVGVVDEETRTVATRLTPAEPCPWLVPGSFVDVVFTTGRGPASGAPNSADAGQPQLLVPRDAVVDVQGVPIVFVQTAAAATTFEARAVRTRPADGPDVVVESGLADGEHIVTSGALLLKGEVLRAELEGH